MEIRRFKAWMLPEPRQKESIIRLGSGKWKALSTGPQPIGTWEPGALTNVYVRQQDKPKSSRLRTASRLLGEPLRT